MDNILLVVRAVHLTALVVAAAIGHGAADDVVAGELASKVAMGTQFGRTCLLRLGLATALVFNVPMLNPRWASSQALPNDGYHHC